MILNTHVIYLLDKCLILMISPLLFKKARNVLATFAGNPQTNINSLKKRKYGYLVRPRSDKACNGTVVNRALTSLQRGSLEITLTVP